MKYKQHLQLHRLVSFLATLLDYTRLKCPFARRIDRLVSEIEHGEVIVMTAFQHSDRLLLTVHMDWFGLVWLLKIM